MPEEKDIPQRQTDDQAAEQTSVQASSIGPSATQPANMEVHHHPDLHHKKKKFTEYLLEFIMIFLAVTMGFFAESLREHIGDNSRQKEYMSSMVAELKYDTAEYNKVLQKIVYLRPLLDSLFVNVKDAERFHYVLQGRWNTPINETRLPYMPTLPTIQQLKSSGNLRLIQSKPVLKKMLEYETFVQGTMQNEAATITTAVEKIYAKEDDMCDESEFNEMTDKNMKDTGAQFSMENGSLYAMPLIVKDPVKLNELANSFINYKSRNWGYNTNVNQAKLLATELIMLVNKEYNPENE